MDNSGDGGWPGPRHASALLRSVQPGTDLPCPMRGSDSWRLQSATGYRFDVSGRSRNRGSCHSCYSSASRVSARVRRAFYEWRIGSELYGADLRIDAIE